MSYILFFFLELSRGQTGCCFSKFRAQFYCYFKQRRPRPYHEIYFIEKLSTSGAPEEMLLQRTNCTGGRGMPQVPLRNMLQQILAPCQLLKDIPMLLKKAIYFHPPLIYFSPNALYFFSTHFLTLYFNFLILFLTCNPFFFYIVKFLSHDL